MSRHKPLPERMRVQSRLKMQASDLKRYQIGEGTEGSVFKLPISGKKDLRKMFPEMHKDEAKSIIETLRSRGFDQSNMHVIVKQMSYEETEDLDEMKMHQALSRMSRGQEFIPTLVGGGDSSDNDDKKQWIISMPVGRDIKDLDRLLRSKTRLSPAEKTVIARSLVDGTLYFHTNSIALLDIKTPNILTGFLSQSEEKGNVRTAWMCDLGLFKKTSGALRQEDQKVSDFDNSDSTASSFDDLKPLDQMDLKLTGTLLYCPIEHFSHAIEGTTGTTNFERYNDSDQTLEDFAFKRDAWSLSMVLWELFSGKDLLQWIKTDSEFDFIRKDYVWLHGGQISPYNQLKFREVVSQKIKECAETTEFLSNERPELPITVKKSSFQNAKPVLKKWLKNGVIIGLISAVINVFLGFALAVASSGWAGAAPQIAGVVLSVLNAFGMTTITALAGWKAVALTIGAAAVGIGLSTVGIGLVVFVCKCVLVSTYKLLEFSAKSVTSYFKSQQKSVNQDVVVSDQTGLYLKDVMLQCSAVKASDRKTLQEVYDASSLKVSRESKATIIQTKARSWLLRKAADKLSNVSDKRRDLWIKKFLNRGFMVGVGLSSIGVLIGGIFAGGAPQVAGAVLSFIGISTTATLTALQTASVIAGSVLAGGIGCFVGGIGVLLIMAGVRKVSAAFSSGLSSRPINVSDSSVHPVAQNDFNIEQTPSNTVTNKSFLRANAVLKGVQASSFKPQASSSIRGQVQSSVSPIKNGVEGGFTLQETTSRGSQVASSVRAKEGVANPKNRSDHVSSSPRALGG